MSAVAGPRAGTLIGTPEGEQIKQVPDMPKLLEYLRNPKVCEAIDRVEKHDFGGKPSSLKVAVFYQAVHNSGIDMRYKYNKKIIDRALKQAGKK